MTSSPRAAITASHAVVLVIAWASGSVAFISSVSRAADEVAGSLVVLNDNGAWSWFEDPRAIIDLEAGDRGKLLVSSVAHGSGSGGAKRHGNVEVVAFDLATGRVERFVLHDGLQADDHNSAALLVLPDGRYLASYSKHSSDRLVRWRVSSRPGDITAWEAEQVFEVNSRTGRGGTTYSNLFYLSASNHIFNFHRAAGPEGGFDPHYLKWQLDGKTAFSYGGRLLTGPEGNTGHSDRPYVRYATNGVDRVDFLVTDAHPRNLVSNSVYHGYLQYESAGTYGLYRSDGTRLGDLSDTSTSPFKASDFTTLLAGNTIFPVNGLRMTRGWITDIRLDTENRPRAVFTARVDDDAADHRFFYARFTGADWNVHELAKAGGFLYRGEDDYTGLAALHPQELDQVFISTNVDPRSDEILVRYEIFAGTTSDDGASWDWQPITFNSTVDNLRPIALAWGRSYLALLWMRGIYTTFTEYDLAIVGLVQFGPLSYADSHDRAELPID